MGSEREGCDFVLPEACSLFSSEQQNRNISEFVVPLHCFFLSSEYRYTSKLFFQNNMRVMLLTSSFPTVLKRAQSGVTMHGFKSRNKSLMSQEIWIDGSQIIKCM